MNSIPGYDAWLEEPYQKAYKEEALYEAFVESEAERIEDQLQIFIADEYLNLRIENNKGIVKELVQLDNLIQQVADLLANLRSYDDRLVDNWVDREATDGHEDQTD